MALSEKLRKEIEGKAKECANLYALRLDTLPKSAILCAEAGYDAGATHYAEKLERALLLLSSAHDDVAKGTGLHMEIKDFLDEATTPITNQ